MDAAEFLQNPIERQKAIARAFALISEESRDAAEYWLDSVIEGSSESFDLPAHEPLHGLRDNYRRGTVADFLKANILEGSNLSIVSAYFTIYAYDALREYLDGIGHLDFLFGDPAHLNRLDPSRTETKHFLINETGLELANKLQQKRVAKDCAKWIEEKVSIKTIRQSNLLHGKLYHIATGVC